MKKFITRINGLCDSNLKTIQDYVAESAYASGWMDMALYVYNNTSESNESRNARFDGIIAGISPGDIVVFQLPTGNGHTWDQDLISRIKAYGGIVIPYIHFLEYAFLDHVDSIGDVIFTCTYQKAIIVDSFELRNELVAQGIKASKILVRELANEWFDDGYYIAKTIDLAAETAVLGDKCRYQLIQKDKERSNSECKFSHYVARASYERKVAISYKYEGDADAIEICSGNRILWQTDNLRKHYALVEAEDTYTIRAVVYTQMGKMQIVATEEFGVSTYPYDINNPKISLVIPMYNSSPKIVRTIDSVLGQSQEDIELILVDDESTDNTVEIVEWYSEEYKNVNLIKKENGGQGSARNAGIDFAHGEYITFMDHDDTIPPDSQKILYELITSTNTDIGEGNTLNVISEDRSILVSSSWQEKEVIDAENYMSTHSPVLIWNKIYKADLCKKIHFVPRHHEDISWSPIIFSYANSISMTSSVVYEWDRTDVSQSVKNLERTEEWFTETYCIAVMDALERCNPEKISLVKRMILSCESFNYHPGLYDVVKKIVNDYDRQ